ncbi:MAG: STAS domain-containing protein [Betaproteobacteria bacterium]|nr:STAS domain-containing protein [Betaproteobacteria bacterium]
MNFFDATKAFRFRPRLLAHLKTYNRDDFAQDLASGVTVAMVALPLAMAFGIASGVRPEQGIVTAIVAGFLISALGGSKVQIGGPAGAFVALLYSIAEKYGVANLLIATMMAGVLLFAMGAFRLGNLVRFIPVSIVIGFTAGIAVIIAISQIKDLLGLDIPKAPSNFFSQLAVITEQMHTFNWRALAIGATSLALIAFWPVSQNARASRWRGITARLPSTIVVLVLSSLVVWALDLPVETIGSKFGELPRGLPVPHFPAFDWDTARNLVAPTIAIALLCAIESLLCARVADGLINDRHDPNQELMAQGVANFFTPFFGGIAATGTIARTMTNVRSGARSPVAGIVHAATLLLVILVAAPLAAHIPLAALAAILLWVAYSMAEWAQFAKLRHFSMFYRATLLSTFFLTVIFDLVVAVEVGLIMASLFFIYRISSLTRVHNVDLPFDQSHLPDGRSVGAVRIFGSLFFGSVTKLEHLLDPSHKLPDVLILEMHQVINIDTTGLDALESLHKLLAKRGGLLMIAGVNEQPLSLMRRSGFVKHLGEGNLRSSLEDALYIVGAPRETMMEREDG